MFRLKRQDVEWLLRYQEQLRIAYQIRPVDRPLPLSYSDLHEEDLSGLPLEKCNLHGAVLDHAHLTDTQLRNANLEYAFLTEAHLEGADLREAWLAHADLREAWFDDRTQLAGAHLFAEREPSPEREYVRAVRLSGVRWNDTDVSSVADLDEFRRLGDDVIPWLVQLRYKLRRDKDSERQKRLCRWQREIGHAEKHQKYLSDAIAAYRPFATALRNSGLSYLAVRSEYRARQLERQVRHPARIRWSGQTIDRMFRHAQEIIELKDKHEQGQTVSRKLVGRTWYVFSYRFYLALRGGFNSCQYYCTRGASFLLDLICGYGYKPLRILAAYILTVLVFARIYATYPPRPHTPHGWNTIWFSMIAFHGRGVISGDIDPDSGMLWVPALEAVIGLGIEALLVAIIIRRLFRN